LLVAAGLMIRTVGYLRSIDPGFRDPETVLTGRLYVPPFVVQEPERVAQIQRALLGRLAAIPGVEAAGAATAVGTENWVWVNSVHVRERLRPEEAAQPMRRLVWIAGAFLEAMETRLLAGRTFDDGEMEGGRPVALVSAGFAAEFWDDPAKAIGSHVALRRDGSWQEIVGVVEDVRAAGLDAAAPAMVYFPAFSRTLFGEPWVQRDLRFVVKSASRDPSTLGPTLREVGRTAAPGVPLTDIRTAADIVSASMARTTFITTMLTVAGALALFLGGIGVYGVIAYLVALRTRELGLRLALGATTRDVGWLMLRHGGALAIGGVVAGLAVSAAATRVLRAVLVGVQPLDPATYLAVAGGLLACAFLASAIPAVRAARVDPAATLRAE